MKTEGGLGRGNGMEERRGAGIKRMRKEEGDEKRGEKG